MSTIKAWVGFVDDKPHFGYTADTYRDGTPFDAITVFKSRAEARYRFQDVRRCYVTISETRKKKRVRSKP